MLVLLAGVLFGVGAYTYLAFRFSYVLLGVTLVFVPWTRWTALAGRRAGAIRGVRWSPLVAFAVTIALVALPLVAFALRQPEAFSSRVRHVSVLAAEDPPRALWNSAARTAGMFFVHGDRNPRHSPGQAPVLPWSVSPFFALGILVAVATAIRRPGEVARGETQNVGPAHLLGGRGPALFLLCWLVILALPVVLTARGVPHALRSIGMLPAAFMLAARGVIAAADALGRLHPKAALALAGCVVSAAAFQGFRAYFVDWARDPLVRESFRQDLVEKAAYLQTQAAGAGAYVIANGRGLPAPYPHGLPMPAQTLLFLLHEECVWPARTGACPRFVRPEELDSLLVDAHRPNVFVLLRDDSPDASRLSNRFPGGVWRRLKDSSVYLWPR